MSREHKRQVRVMFPNATKRRFWFSNRRFPNLARDLHVAGHHEISKGWSWKGRVDILLRNIGEHRRLTNLCQPYESWTYLQILLLFNFRYRKVWWLFCTDCADDAFVQYVLLVAIFIALLVFLFQVINFPSSFAIPPLTFTIALSNHQHHHHHSHDQSHLLVQSNQRSRSTFAAKNASC